MLACQARDIHAWLTLAVLLPHNVHATPPPPTIMRAPRTAGAAAAGWVSGTVQRPESCKHVPTDVCKSCAASKDTTRCLRCAWDDRAKPRKPLEYLLGDADDVQMGCGVCTSLTPGSREADE